MRIDSPWLTVRRVRVYGLLLAVCLWSAYAVDLATPGLRDRAGLIKGTDFVQFYTIGNLALHGNYEFLYDVRAFASVTQKLVPQAAGMVYAPLYGPQILLLFVPFAHLPYTRALLVWLLLNAALYACCVYAVWKACPRLRQYPWTVLILALAFPGFFHLIAWGQTSGLGLACFTAAFLALRSKRRFVAGLAIGCLMFKPQLGLAAAVVFLMSREGEIVLGAVLSATAQLALAWWSYGTQLMRTYAHALLHAREILPLLEPRPYQMHSLWHFWSLLIPWQPAAFTLYMISAVAVLAVTVRCWQSALPLGVRYSTLLIATVLVSPHLSVYDLVILAPAFLLLSDWAAGASGERYAKAIPLLLYACYFLFLLGPLFQYTHLQLSVPVMTALLWSANAATLNTP
jgi:hypothetical protein